MASIYKRPSKHGKGHTWRAVIRIKGHPVVCKTCDRKEEAENWAAETERLIKRGQYNFETSKRQFTYADLHERLHADGVLLNKRAFKNVRSQFDHWENRLGVYALVHITLEVLSKERQHLIEQLAAKGLEPNHGTINRYKLRVNGRKLFTKLSPDFLADNFRRVMPQLPQFERDLRPSDLLITPHILSSDACVDRNIRRHLNWQIDFVKKSPYADTEALTKQIRETVAASLCKSDK